MSAAISAALKQGLPVLTLVPEGTLLLLEASKSSSLQLEE